MEDLIDLLISRDQISYNEACNLIEECKFAISTTSNYNEAIDILNYYLGLEPDYLDILLE